MHGHRGVPSSKDDSSRFLCQPSSNRLSEERVGRAGYLRLAQIDENFAVPPTRRAEFSFLVADCRVAPVDEPVTASVRSRIELGTKRESLLQVLDEDANLGGHPATGRTHGKDRHRPLKGCQKPQNCTFSQLCGEQPCRRLGK